MKPLTIHQKRYLAHLSNRAFNRDAALARGRGDDIATDTAAREAYRHSQVLAACGKLGLRCCSQDDYKAVQAHFLHILGEEGKALNAYIDHHTEPRRVAVYKVVEACQDFGFHLSYADSICRDQNHGAGLQDVDTKTLWRLVFTIRNRGLAKKRHAAAA